MAEHCASKEHGFVQFDARMVAHLQTLRCPRNHLVGPDTSWIQRRRYVLEATGTSFLKRSQTFQKAQFDKHAHIVTYVVAPVSLHTMVKGISVILVMRTEVINVMIVGRIADAKFTCEACELVVVHDGSRMDDARRRQRFGTKERKDAFAKLASPFKRRSKRVAWCPRDRIDVSGQSVRACHSPFDTREPEHQHTLSRLHSA